MGAAQPSAVGITDLLMFKACHSWSALDLHVEEIHVLPVSQFLLFLIPMLLKKQA